MAERLSDWNNQDPSNKNLEELSILINQLMDKIQSLEERIEALGG